MLSAHALAQDRRVKPGVSLAREIDERDQANPDQNRLQSAQPSLPPGVVVDPTEILAETGLLSSHWPAILGVSKKTDTIIAFRPVEWPATQLIEEGYPTKNFHIKGKSSNWGPMAGFIPVNQQLSKLEGEGSRIAKFNASVASCLAEGHATSGPLAVSRERLQFLEKRAVLEKQSRHDGKVTIVSIGPGSGKPHEFEGDPHQRKYWISHSAEPLQVLCDPKSGLPLTADYDLLLVAPSGVQYGSPLGPEYELGSRTVARAMPGGHYNADRLPVGDVSPQILQSRLGSGPYARRNSMAPDARATLEKLTQDPRLFFSEEDPDLGNASPRVVALIELLNEAMRKVQRPDLPYQRVVHHNMDASSPATDPAANYPATVFLPRPLGNLPEMVLVRDEFALGYVIQLAKDEGYQIPLNPLWPNLRHIRRSRFLEGQRAVAHLLQRLLI